MTLGERIIALRKKKKMSQGQLGKKIGTSGDIIGRYERNEVKPSIEVAIKIADALEVSLDYLVGKADFEIDLKTLNRLKEIDELPEENKAFVIRMVDMALQNFKAKNAFII